MEGDLMTAEDVAVLLRLHRRTVYEMTRRAEAPLPVFGRVGAHGRRMLFKREEVMAWVEEGETVRKRNERAQRALP